MVPLTRLGRPADPVASGGTDRRDETVDPELAQAIRERNAAQKQVVSLLREQQQLQAQLLSTRGALDQALRS